MEKLSQQEIDVLKEVPATLNKLAAERDFYKDKAAAYERRDEAVKVAQAMHEKGINTDVEFSDLVGRLEKQAEAGKLDEISRAVEMVGPDMGQKIASLSEPGSPGSGGGSVSDLERYVLGGVG